MTTDNCLTASPTSTAHHLSTHDPVVIGVAEAMPLRATTTVLTPRRWLRTLRDLHRALPRRRTARRRQPVRRGDYMERAAMAREMHRL